MVCWLGNSGGGPYLLEQDGVWLGYSLAGRGRRQWRRRGSAGAVGSYGRRLEGVAVVEQGRSGRVGKRQKCLPRRLRATWMGWRRWKGGCVVAITEQGAVADGCARRLEMTVLGRGRKGVEDADAATKGSIVAGEATEAAAAGNKVAAVDRTGMGEEEEREGLATAIGRRCRQHRLWHRWVWEEDGGKEGVATSSPVEAQEMAAVREEDADDGSSADGALTALDKARIEDESVGIRRQGRRRSSFWLRKKEQGVGGRGGGWVRGEAHYSSG
ncbi:hypothetical protein GW17_00056215 [Ensete ventricosum]|nr:hypothetical protein GW17_00056215 [Ensete ventricosum]